MKLATRPFAPGDWSAALRAELAKMYPGLRLRRWDPRRLIRRRPVPTKKVHPHFEINLGFPAWKSTVEMDGVKLNSVREVLVRASVDGLTEVRLTMYGTVKLIGANGVEVDKIVLCPSCQEKFEGGTTS